MTLARLSKILEIFWWVVAAITLFIVLLMIYLEGTDKWATWFLAPLIAVLAALVRRFAAKRLGRSELEQAERDKKG